MTTTRRTGPRPARPGPGSPSLPAAAASSQRPRRTRHPPPRGQGHARITQAYGRYPAAAGTGDPARTTTTGSPDLTPPIHPPATDSYMTKQATAGNFLASMANGELAELVFDVAS